MELKITNRIMMWYNTCTKNKNHGDEMLDARLKISWGLGAAVLHPPGQRWAEMISYIANSKERRN